MKRIISLCILFAYSFQGFSCNCIGTGVERRYSESEAVVVAKMMTAKQILIRRDTSNIHFMYADYRRKNKDPRMFNEFLLSFLDKEQMVEYTFLVSKSFKGIKISDTLKVLSPLYSAACGIPFTSENDYLIYARKLNYNYVYISDLAEEAGKLPKEMLFTDKCSGTVIFSNNSADLPLLNKIKAD